MTFDNWHTQPGFCRYLEQTLPLPYVGTLAGDDHVLLQRGPQRLAEFAEHLKQEHLATLKRGGKPTFHPITIRYKGEKERYYSYCATHRIAHFGWQRLVIAAAHGAGADGRSARPRPASVLREWEEALACAVDEIWNCPRCRQHFPYPCWLIPAPRRACPFCGGRVQPPYPVVLELYEERQKHNFVPVSRRVVVGHGFKLFADVTDPAPRFSSGCDAR